MTAINTLAIIGVGLIGGSLAMALRKTGYVDQVIGCGRSEQNLVKAKQLGVVDEWTQDVGKAVENADMVFVAVPLGAMQSIFSTMQGHLKDTAVVTDGGSAKASVVKDWLEASEGKMLNFVPGHPIAGTENSGVEAAFDSLYQDRRVILTPTPDTNTDALGQVTAMWRACGAEVTSMPVQQHDAVLAATSHLPHMLAFGLVDTLDKLEEHTEIFRYAAGGFRDFSRIASSNPEMWRDICLSNADAVSRVLDLYIEEMIKLSGMIKNRKADELLELFRSAKQARDQYVDGL
ncbi:MAG: prephenate dehydrogenase/arogenate dehydrogenase family protein [Chromatiales bacterium]|jgi:prephenate dehydrogenase